MPGQKTHFGMQLAAGERSARLQRARARARADVGVVMRPDDV